MTWLTGDKRFVRCTLLLLLIIAMMGPWVFDRIHVPAEYICEAPFIRLDGDFCGSPTPWVSLFAWFTDGFLITLQRLISGFFAGQARELLAVLVVFLPMLPFFSTLLVMGSKSSPRLQTIHLIAWGLGCIFPLLILFLERGGQVIQLWGTWLYLLLATGALMTEISIRREQSSPPGRAL